MNLLELFSGGQSVGRVLKKYDFNVISVDINDYKGKHIPTHKINILEFDYKQYPKNYFNIIWGSPPCVYYSNLQNCWIGRKKADGIIFTREMLNQKRKEMDQLVLKVFEIIEYFNPKYWFIENPQTGLLKNRYIMKDKKLFYDVDYCKYSNWGYRKRTRIWTNKLNFKPLVCCKDCNNMNDSKTKHIKNVSDIGGGSNRLGRYRIPEKLIISLII